MEGRTLVLEFHHLLINQLLQVSPMHLHQKDKFVQQPLIFQQSCTLNN